jgi:AcrR family transcriptional regulator
MSSRRDQILEATRELLLADGLHGVSMRKVADRVGVSATAIYRHYADKDALIEAAVLQGRHVLLRNFQRVLATTSPRARLQRTGEEYLRFAMRHPTDYQVLFMAWDRLPVGLPNPRSEKGFTPTFQFLLDRVEECVGAGLLPQGTSRFDVAMLCWSVCHGLASLYLTGGVRTRMKRADFQRLSDHVVTLTLDGLFGRTGRRSRTRSSRGACC